MMVQVSALHADALAVLHATSFPQPWAEAEFAALLGQPGVAAWMWGHDGFILVRAVGDEAEILTLAVAPTQRRKGVAGALLQEAARVLKHGGGQKLYLEVASDNAAALALYAKQGFAATGRRAGYYAHGADAVTMTLVLS